MSAKELPIAEPSHKYQPVYVQGQFWDGTELRTPALPHAKSCKWCYKQVVLAGLMDTAQLIEYLMTKPLKVA